MTTLVLAEQEGGKLSSSTAKAVGAAVQMGAEVHVLVVGEGAQAASERVAKLTGVTKVLCAEHAALKHQLAEPVAEVLLALAGSYDAIVACATARGKNVLPRLAALLDVMVISDVSKVVGPKTFERPIYAGNAIACVESLDHKVVMSVRSASFDEVEQGGNAVIEVLSVSPTEKAQFVKLEATVSERPELNSAKVVISGGRALASAENFQNVLEPLADTLNAAIGASRAAVDAGYAPNDFQVGQTGKVVAPDLYIAIGISGAIQHLAGMKDSKVIVAINKDAEAPIFQIASYGLVGDLFTLVPELTSALQNLKNTAAA